MRTGGGRAKGHAFERAIVLKLREAGFTDARRNLSQTRTAKQEGPDVLGTPWWLELSHSAANVEAQKWRQAVRDSEVWAAVQTERAATHPAWAAVPMPPVVITKQNRRQPIVTMHASTAGLVAFPEPEPLVSMNLDDWLRLIRHRQNATVQS